MWAFTVITRTKGKRHSAAGIPEKLSIGQCRFGTFCLRCRKTNGSILGLCTEAELGRQRSVHRIGDSDHCGPGQRDGDQREFRAAEMAWVGMKLVAVALVFFLVKKNSHLLGLLMFCFFKSWSDIHTYLLQGF